MSKSGGVPLYARSLLCIDTLTEVKSINNEFIILDLDLTMDGWQAGKTNTQEEKSVGKDELTDFLPTY